MKLYRASAMVGKKKDYFFVMRKHQPEKFQYLQSKGCNLVEAYLRYEEEVEETMMKLQEIFYKLEEERKQYAFSILAHEAGIYGSQESLLNSLERMIFTVRDRAIQFSAYKKLKQLIPLYEANKHILFK